MATLQERYRGCLLGLACGDAVGTTVEFSPRGSFPPVTGMTGGGPFHLPAGAWTDDTSMALCLATSLVHRQGFDAVDQMNRYSNWREYGYLSSTGECFDIGRTVDTALRRYRTTREPFAGGTDPHSAGNGALMRLAPVPMAYRGSEIDTLYYAAESTRTTHGATEAVDCSLVFAAQLRLALSGAEKLALLRPVLPAPESPRIAAILHMEYAAKPEAQIIGDGYSVHALEAALWCFLHTDTFEAAVLAAANLGDDADTTAAICGQIAGAYYGVDGIPARWRETVMMAPDILALADALLALSERPSE